MFSALTFDTENAARSDSAQDSVPRVLGSPRFLCKALCIDQSLRFICVSSCSHHSVFFSYVLFVRSVVSLTSTPAYVPPTAAKSAACVPIMRPVLTRAGQAWFLSTAGTSCIASSPSRPSALGLRPSSIAWFPRRVHKPSRWL